MPYRGDGKYSGELVAEHTAGQHEGYLDPNCRMCKIVSAQIHAAHVAGRHEVKTEMCVDCEFPEELAGHPYV